MSNKKKMTHKVELMKPQKGGAVKEKPIYVRETALHWIDSSNNKYSKKDGMQIKTSRYKGRLKLSTLTELEE